MENHSQYGKWKGRPATNEKLEEAEQQNCFYKLFVPMCPSYLVHNINLHAHLANGTSIREHSLAFDSVQEKTRLDDMIAAAPVGSTIDLEEPPTAIKVEIYPDFYGDDQQTRDEKAQLRKAWTRGSIVNDGRVIIPIDRKTGRYRNESISASGSVFHFNASSVPMADYFPVELGFCITVPKAQGRTINKLIASLSKHPSKFLRLRWEQLYVILSRIPHRNEMRLLLQMGNRNTLQYISELEKDPYTTYYFAGFPRESNSELVYWDPTLAARAAGFLEKDK